LRATCSPELSLYLRTYTDGPQHDWRAVEILHSDETVPLPPLLPGGHTCLKNGRARGLTIHPGHIEYGRGAVVTTLPFAMVDTLLVSIELESVRISTVEFDKLLRRRFRH
jgi:hypothetical protein